VHGDRLAVISSPPAVPPWPPQADRGDRPPRGRGRFRYHGGGSQRPPSCQTCPLDRSGGIRSCAAKDVIHGLLVPAVSAQAAGDPGRSIAFFPSTPTRRRLPAADSIQTAPGSPPPGGCGWSRAKPTTQDWLRPASRLRWHPDQPMPPGIRLPAPEPHGGRGIRTVVPCAAPMVKRPRLQHPFPRR